DTLNADFIFSRLKVICQNVFRRFSESGFQSFRTITLTVRFADFQTFTRSQTLSAPTNTAQILQFESMKLLTPFLDKRENPKNKPIRLIGIRVEKLVG
ncbi:MAG: polymerase IV protein, partial [Candidatus Azambacteria bacterium GW2011_GWE2_46_45]